MGLQRRLETTGHPPAAGDDSHLPRGQGLEEHRRAAVAVAALVVGEEERVGGGELAMVGGGGERAGEGFDELGGTVGEAFDRLERLADGDVGWAARVRVEAGVGLDGEVQPVPQGSNGRDLIDQRRGDLAVFLTPGIPEHGDAETPASRRPQERRRVGIRGEIDRIGKDGDRLGTDQRPLRGQFLRRGVEVEPVGGCKADRFVEQAADPADPAGGPSGNIRVEREDGAVKLEVPADPRRRTCGVNGLRESQGIEFGGRGDQNPIARREGGDRGSEIGGEGGHADAALPAP